MLKERLKIPIRKNGEILFSLEIFVVGIALGSRLFTAK